MSKYRAIVSITFDDDDLEEMSKRFRVERYDALDYVTAEMDNLGAGTGWVEQLFKDERPTISRVSGGMLCEINAHE